MTTGEKACDWWSVLLGDEELFTDVQLPAHITDQQFVSLLQKVSLSLSPFINFRQILLVSAARCKGVRRSLLSACVRLSVCHVCVSYPDG